MQQPAVTVFWPQGKDRPTPSEACGRCLVLSRTFAWQMPNIEGGSQCCALYLVLRSAYQAKNNKLISRCKNSKLQLRHCEVGAPSSYFIHFRPSRILELFLDRWSPSGLLFFSSFPTPFEGKISSDDNLSTAAHFLQMPLDVRLPAAPYSCLARQSL